MWMCAFILASAVGLYSMIVIYHQCYSETMIDFKYGGPIEPELFYDRERELDFLIDKLSQVKSGLRHNYALIGPRRTGKTSILYALKRPLARRGVIPILVDCEGREIAEHAELTLESFLELWGDTVLDTYIEQAKLESKIKIRLANFLLAARDKVISALSETLGRLRAIELNSASDYLSLRVELAKSPERPSPRELAKLFEDTVELAERLGEEKDVYFVMMLDEFQHVANFKKPIDFLSRFRRHMQHQKRVAYLLTGSNIGMMEKIMLGRPMGGHVPVEWVGPFERATAYNFLKERFSALRRKVDDAALDEIVRFTGGYPAYLNWFGEQCCRETKLGGVVSLELVKMLERKIFEREGLMHVFDEDLRKLSPKKGKLHQTFVEMAGHGLSSPTEISKRLTRVTPVEVITYLRRMEERGFVRRVRKGEYEAADKMLEKYVREKIHVTP